MRFGPALFLILLVPGAAFAAPPRVTFERRIPPPYDLGRAENVAVVSALGDTASIEFLVEQMIEQAGRSGTLRLHDVRGQRHPLVLETLKRAEPADGWLAVRAFSCASEVRRGEGSTRDADGKRVRQPQAWIETRCTARLEVLTAAGARISVPIKGEAASPRVPFLGGEEREDAQLHATRFAAIDAVEKIAPRRVRESIPLDESAPGFEEGLAMIEAGRLAEARAIWENEVRRHPRAAPLHYNLAAICEAVGDRGAAERHHAAARQLAPGEAWYSTEYRAFLRRAN